MKVALIHNYYQLPGGEDVGFHNDRALFLSRGDEVVEFTRHNDEIKEYSAFDKIRLSVNTTYNGKVKKELSSFLRLHQPAVAHFHNTFPLISPAAYDACIAAGVPVVQTLHNYRLVCPNAILYRDGSVCEECLPKSIAWPAIRHKCYRGSCLHSAVVVAMHAVHRSLKTWNRKVDAYIVLNKAMRDKLVAAGLPVEKVFVKPNSVEKDPGVREGERGYALFLGRLSEEKGAGLLPEAWRSIEDFPLKIAGDGPEKGRLESQIRKNSLRNVDLLGHVSKEEVFTLISNAAFLILPSLCYETFPRAVIESFACGVPVIASRLGAAREIIEDGKTGLLFSPGDSLDLAVKVRWALEHQDAMREMGRSARREYEEKYSSDTYYRSIIGIYQALLASAKERRGNAAKSH